MKFIISSVVMAALAATSSSAQQPAKLDATTAGRFAALALACVQKEYPNKIAHVLNSADDVKAPSQLTPVFYGCYDWHSAVHAHWLLARLVREFPDAASARDAVAALKANITPERVAGEVAYLNATGVSRSSAHMVWRGCCSWPRSCVNRRRRNWIDPGLRARNRFDTGEHGGREGARVSSEGP